MNKLFFPRVGEQTIYFALSAEQSSPPQESNGRTLSILSCDIKVFHNTVRNKGIWLRL